MAHQVRSFEVLIAAGSTRQAPQVIPIGFPPFIVVSIEVEIPPGPLGQVGFQIASSRQQVIPWNTGSWIIANNATKKWEADNYPTSGDWQVIAYNTGALPHTIYVTFELDPVGADPAAAAPPLVSVAALSATGAGSAQPPPDAGDLADTLPPPPPEVT